MSSVPNLPPTSNIQDPAVRSYLDALSHMLSVRNGSTKDVSEQFVTINELREAVTFAKRGATAGQPTKATQALATIIKDILDK